MPLHNVDFLACRKMNLTPWSNKDCMLSIWSKRWQIQGISEPCPGTSDAQLDVTSGSPRLRLSQDFLFDVTNKPAWGASITCCNRGKGGDESIVFKLERG
jgi:hypothetical protein